MASEGIKKRFGLTAVGNALVDILAPVDDAFMTAQEAAGMKKGAMMLIDAARAAALEALVSPEREMSGGSVANTVSGFVSFGGDGAFMGKVANDRLGVVFRRDLREQGVYYRTRAHRDDDLQTGRSYVFVTPDGERTMNTFLGANDAFGPDDIDESVIADSQIVLLEGYLFDRPGAKAAFDKVVNVAKGAGTRIAFTLSDARCVERHHADFAALAKNVDILIGNEKEIKALTLRGEFRDAADAAAGTCETVVLTRGGKGAEVYFRGDRHYIPVQPLAKMVDTTGAGDAFAAGFLYGASRGFNLEKCGELGAKAASKTISHFGARSPDVKFSELLI